MRKVIDGLHNLIFGEKDFSFNVVQDQSCIEKHAFLVLV